MGVLRRGLCLRQQSARHCDRSAQAVLFTSTLVRSLIAATALLGLADISSPNTKQQRFLAAHHTILPTTPPSTQHLNTLGSTADQFEKSRDAEHPITGLLLQTRASLDFLCALRRSLRLKLHRNSPPSSNLPAFEQDHPPDFSQIVPDPFDMGRRKKAVVPLDKDHMRAGDSTKSPKQQRADARASHRATYGHRRTHQLGLRDLRALHKQHAISSQRPRSHPQRAILPARIYRVYGIDPGRYRDIHSRQYWRPRRAPVSNALVSQDKSMVPGLATEPGDDLLSDTAHDAHAHNAAAATETSVDRVDEEIASSRNSESSSDSACAHTAPLDSTCDPTVCVHSDSNIFDIAAHNRLLASLLIPSDIQVMMVRRNKHILPDEDEEDEKEQPPSKKSRKTPIGSGNSSNSPRCPACNNPGKEAQKFTDPKNPDRRICLSCKKSIELQLAEEKGAKTTCDGCNNGGKNDRNYNDPRPGYGHRKICRKCRKELKDGMEDAKCFKCERVGKDMQKHDDPRPGNKGKKICEQCYVGMTGKHTCSECGHRFNNKKRNDPRPATKGATLCRNCYDHLDDPVCNECGEKGGDRHKRVDPRPEKDGQRICPKCYDDLVDRAQLQCSNCPAKGPDSQRNVDKRPGKEGNRICRACHDALLDECDSCGRVEMGSRECTGPDNSKICSACFYRPREPPFSMNAPEYKRTCLDCGRHHSDSWNQPEGWRRHELCEYCYERRKGGVRHRRHSTVLSKWPTYSFEQLEALATRHWREMHPGIDPSVDVMDIPRSSENYIDMPWLALRNESFQRGVRDSREASIFNFANILMLDDALNGILPRAPIEQPSRYHAMRPEAIIKEAVARGAKSEGVVRKARRDNPQPDEDLVATVQLYIQWLLKDDEENDRDPWGEADETGRTQTNNRSLSGDPRVLRELSNHVWRGESPTDTSGAGFLCGPRALAITISSLRYEGILVGNSWAHGFQQIDCDEILRCLFEDVTEERPLGPNDIGTPTRAYRRYLEQRFPASNADGDGDEQVDYDTWMLQEDENRRMLAPSSFNVDQLQAALTLLYRRGRIPYDFQLAYIRSPPTQFFDNGNFQTGPSPVQTVGEFDENRMRAFVYINIARSSGDDDEGNSYNHFEGMSVNGRPGFDRAWGIPRGDAGEHARRRFNRNDPSHVTTEEAEALARSRNKQQLKARKEKKIRSGCVPCQDMKSGLCDGVRFEKACSQCEEDGKECTWPSHFPPKPVKKKASELTNEDYNDREQPFPELDVLETAKSCQPDPEPDKDHIVCIYVARRSGGDWSDTMHLHGVLQKYRHFHSQLLGHPQYVNNPQTDPSGVSHIPTDANGDPVPVRTLLVPLIRHGGKMVPCSTDNLQDPFLIVFVQLMRAMCDAAARRRPLEIQIITSGIPGFSVGIERWENLFNWVLQQDAANNTNVAGSIYLVPAVETHLVDGVAAHSFDPQNRSQGWTGYRYKYWQKNKLSELIGRNRMNIAVSQMRANLPLINQQLAHLQQPPITPQQLVVPFHPAGARHDAYNEVAKASADWRGATLDQTTTPTAAIVRSRQNKRNEAPRNRA